MAKLTPVYYLESGTVKFWQEEGSTSSATVITPNAIVAKKQSNAEITYNPYEKYTLVAIYKGEAEIGDLVTGKKMLLKPTDEGKPRVAIISFTSMPQTQESIPVLPAQPISGFNIGVLVAVGIFTIILGYIVVRKKSYLKILYNKIKAKIKIRQLGKK